MYLAAGYVVATLATSMKSENFLSHRMRPETNENLLV